MIEEKIYFNLGKMTAVIFVCCMAIILIAGFDVFTAKARDIRRRLDMETLVKALELYHGKYGNYPDSVDDSQGWDLSYDLKGNTPGFLKALKDEGFLNREVKDFINDASYHYRYKKYGAGSFGCPGSFYILQISLFEAATKNIGKGSCPDFDWAELAPNGYTIQGFE